MVTRVLGKVGLRLALALMVMMPVGADASRHIYYSLPDGSVPLDSRDRNDLFHYGRKLCSEGKYGLALEYFRRAILISESFDDQLRVGEAECLWHLKQEPEANSILTEVQHRDPTCDQASLTKAKLCTDSGQYDDALKAADFLQRHSVWGPEEAYLLRSRIYQKQNRMDLAKEQAQCAYYHCEHLGTPTNAAIARLEELGCAAVYTVNRQKNNLVFAAIDELLVPKPDYSRKNFERIFGRRFEEVSHSDRGFYLTSISREQLFQNVQLRGSFNRNHSWIWITVNPDETSITQNEVLAKYGHDNEKSSSAAPGVVEVLNSIQYRRPPFCSIDFNFATGGSKCLTDITIDYFRGSG